MRRSLLGSALFLTLALATGDRALAPAAESATPAHPLPPPIPSPQPSAAQLFAAVERAWNAGDATALASLCDSAVVRIALKPGSPPAAAPTLGAAAFLIHDQLRLADSRRFHVARLEVDGKRRTARAQARWLGAWGGGRGQRDLEVHLQARSGETGWLLSEIRAKD